MLLSPEFNAHKTKFPTDCRTVTCRHTGPEQMFRKQSIVETKNGHARVGPLCHMVEKGHDVFMSNFIEQLPNRG